MANPYKNHLIQQNDKKIKTDVLEELSDDILKYEAAGYLPLQDLSRATKINKRGYHLFSRSFHEMAVTKLLEHVVRGEQTEAEKMIKAYPELLTMKGNVTDYSGRKFKNLTAFEYTLWALDRHMWTMMLSVSMDKKENEIKQSLLEQYQSLENSSGVQFIFNEKIYKEQHYDFAVIDKLQKYVDNLNLWNPQQKIKYWCEEVGSMQRMVPCHVANEYCHPKRSFHPIPAFKKEPNLPRQLNFSDMFNRCAGIWFPIVSNSNRSFGICRGYTVGGNWRTNPGRAEGTANPTYWLVTADLNAITALRDVRMEEFKELGSMLTLDLNLQSMAIC